MKFSEILLYLNEQVEDDPNQDDDNIDNGPDPIEPEPEEPEVAEPEPPEPEQKRPADAVKTEPSDQDRDAHRQKVKKKLNAIDKTKLKWREEATQIGVEITENDMVGAIEFFNTKKNGLRPLGAPAGDIPQLFALKQRFPEFPAENEVAIRDIQTYSWEQILFFINRYIAHPEEEQEQFFDEGEQLVVDVDKEDANRIAGLLPTAYEQWKKQVKVYDNNGVSIVALQSKQHSINVGFLENCLKAKHKNTTSQFWCTTWTNASNQYLNYRPNEAFYYVLNINVPESDPFYFFAIAPSSKDRNSYRLVDMYNSNDWSSLNFDAVLSYTNCPELANAKDKVVWFEETEYDSIDRKFDTYAFGEPTGDKEIDKHNFMFLDLTHQREFIDYGRNIRSARALRALSDKAEYPDVEKPVDLQRVYVNLTNAQNMVDRFRTIDENEDIFSMINALRPSPKKQLHSLLEVKEKVSGGIKGLALKLMSNELIGSFLDYTKTDIRLLQSKNNIGTFGIFNMVEFKWEKPLEYTKATPLIKAMDRETKQIYIFQKYISENDYFYWMFNREDYLHRNNPKSPNRLKGKFLEGSVGDGVINSMTSLMKRPRN